MPIYDYKCKCGKAEEHYAGFDDKTLPCACGKMMERQITTHFGICMGVGPYGYYDENLQTYVHTNAHRRQVMQEQGVSEKFGKGWY